MTHAPATTPSILILADDLLATLLIENLVPEGYQVTRVDAALMAAESTAVVVADLLLGEIRTPHDGALQRITHVRVRCKQPMVPVVLLGYGPPPDILGARVTWVHAGAPIGVLLDTIRAIVAPVGSGDHSQRVRQRRSPRVGERRR